MKRIISLLAVIPILAAISLTGASAKSIYDGRPKFGDANHDGSINLEDVVAVQKYVAELDGFSMCRTCANVYEDEVNMIDVVSIQKHIAKLKNNSKCGTDTGEFAFLMPNKLDTETKEKIEKAYLEVDPVSEKDKKFLIDNYGDFLNCEFFDSLSDGTLIVRAERTGMSYPCTVCSEEIGEYIYKLPQPGEEKFLLINDKYLSVKDAYTQGLLSDEIFKEIAFKLHMVKK